MAGLIGEVLCEEENSLFHPAIMKETVAKQIYTVA